MAQKGQGQQGPEVGVGTGILLMLGMLAVLGIAVWFLKHDIVVRIFLMYAYGLVYIPAWLSSLIGWSNSPSLELIRTIVELSWKPHSIDSDVLLSVVNKASIYLFPLLLIPIIIAYRVHTHILRHLEISHDYWHLMKIQSKTNPCIIPVVRFTEYEKVKGLERHNNLFRAFMPDEFATKHNLIKTVGNDKLMDFEKAKLVFAKQVGRDLSTINESDLSEHYKALAAIFMTRIVYRGEEGRRKAQNMQDYINNSCDPNKSGAKQDANCAPCFDFSPAASLYSELIKYPEIQDIRRYFIFETSFLMRLLNEARNDGKLPPSEFVWLKLIDRPLWYALYGVSKKLIAKGYAEGGGAFAQYWSSIIAMEHEQILRGTYMDEAARALEKRLFEANMISERGHMTDKERDREREFGRIPDVG